MMLSAVFCVSALMLMSPGCAQLAENVRPWAEVGTDNEQLRADKKELRMRSGGDAETWRLSAPTVFAGGIQTGVKF